MLENSFRGRKIDWGRELVRRRVRIPVRKFIGGRKIDWGRELVQRRVRVHVRKFIRSR